MFSAANKELCKKFVGEIVELETDSAWGQMNFFRRTSHAGGIHDGEEELELVYIHLGVPVWASVLRERACAGDCSAVTTNPLGITTHFTLGIQGCRKPERGGYEVAFLSRRCSSLIDAACQYSAVNDEQMSGDVARGV